MSVLAAAVVRELGMMHLVTGNESYKTASGVVTRALGQVEEVQVKIGEVKCSMTFMVVDTDGYNVLLGLDFLMKIGAVVDVERGLIQVRYGLGAHMEVLPFTVVNFLQKVNAGQGRNGAAISVKDGPADQDPEVGSDRDQKADEGEEDASVSDDENDDDELHDSESNPLEQSDSDDEFVDPELEELVNSEGPEGMLQLMLQERTDRIMAEEDSDGDDYADWIKWSSDAEENRLSEYGSARSELGTVLLQQHKLEHDFVILEILQTAQVVTDEPDHKPGEGCKSCSHSKSEVRWKEIYERIKVDTNLEKHGQQQLWATLERYKDVFAWNKSELGYCTIGEHSIDTQGFPPCNASPGRLSSWEEAEVER
ncbi:unnamed protein product [Sphagnum troendelagicum]|uniref:Uncharacterized protein n=1 Tax=Sphagnum troendelagicum TaxID=128251 RepID=A0ABP0THX3_9BRYO